jgi:hypothetical protein
MEDMNARTTLELYGAAASSVLQKTMSRPHNNEVTMTENVNQRLNTPEDFEGVFQKIMDDAALDRSDPQVGAVMEEPFENRKSNAVKYQ